MTAGSHEFLTIYSDGLYYCEILTDRLTQATTRHGLDSGYATLLVQHTTSALFLVEEEAGVLVDIRKALQRLFPTDAHYYHHVRGVDSNGLGHVLSGLFNRTLTIPFSEGQLLLGTYQEVLFMDFQPEQAERRVLVTFFSFS